MLTKVGAADAALGFLTFMGFAFAMIYIPNSGHRFEWPMMAAACNMAVGLVLCVYTIHRQNRQEALARIIVQAHGSKGDT